MKNLALSVATIAAILLIGFAFFFGVFPHHDYTLGSFLLLWALVVVWLGGVVGSRS